MRNAKEATNTCAPEWKQGIKQESKEKVSYIWKSTYSSIPFAAQVTVAPFHGIKKELEFKFRSQKFQVWLFMHVIWDML